MRRALPAAYCLRNADPLSQIALILGIVKARSGQSSNFDALFNEGRGYLLKYLGLMLLFAIIGAILGLVALFVFFLANLLFGDMAQIFLIILGIILIPVYVWIMSIVEFSTMNLVLSKKNAVEAFSLSWELIRTNPKQILGAGFVILLLTSPLSFALGAIHDWLVAPLITPPGSTLNGLLFLAVAIVYVVAVTVLSVIGSNLWVGVFLQTQPESKATAEEL